MRPGIFPAMFVVCILVPSLSHGLPSRYDIGAALLIDLPQEDFANISGTGAGLGVKFLRPLGPSFVRLRGDFEILFFGEEEHVVDIEGQLFGVITRHESIRFLAGFELTTPRARPLRLYLAPMAGLYLFRSVDRVTIYHHHSSTDAEFGWKIDAGCALTRFKRRHRPEGLGIDFGVSYGTVENAIKTRAETEESRTTFRTDANEIVIHAGLIWHIR